MDCEYGCKRNAKFFLTYVKKWCCSKSANQCPSMKSRNGDSHKGKPTWNKGKNESGMSGKHHSSQTKKKISKKTLGKSKGKRTEDWKRNRSDFMKNGGAAHANRFIKNSSKPENDLLNLVQQICPYVEHNYPTYRVGKRKNSYNIDISVPKLDLAIEFDGWYHFDTEEHKEYHKKRQQELEEDGWKFLRYNIFQKFPTKEQVLEDIKKVLNGDKQCEV